MPARSYNGPRIDFHVHLAPARHEADSPEHPSCAVGGAGLLATFGRLAGRLGKAPLLTRLYPELSEVGFRWLVRRFDREGRDRLLAELDHHGVSRAVVCAIEPFLDTRDLAHTLSEVPGRLALFASVEPAVGDPVDRLERMVRSHRISGLKLHPPLSGPHPLSARMLELGAWAERRGLPIFVHAGTFPFPVHAHHDDVAELEPLLHHVREVPIVLGHIGWDQHATVLDLARHYRHVAVETSWQPPVIIRRAIDVLGPDRVLMGSDFPLQPVGAAIADVEFACRDAREARLLMHDNAARMMGWPQVGAV